MAAEEKRSCVLFKSSVLLINYGTRTGPVEFNLSKPSSLSPERLKLYVRSVSSTVDSLRSRIPLAIVNMDPVDLRGFNSGNGAIVELLLSVKHILRIEFLDNSEEQGAGLIFHMNDFMANKLQTNMRRITGVPRNMHLPIKFLLVDVINADPRSIQNIREMLREVYNFRRQYIIERLSSLGQTKPDKLPLSEDYISPLPFHDWRTLLRSIGKDVYLEHIEAKANNGHLVNYTIGTVCNYLPTLEPFMQQPAPPPHSYMRTSHLPQGGRQNGTELKTLLQQQASNPPMSLGEKVQETMNAVVASSSFSTPRNLTQKSAKSTPRSVSLRQAAQKREVPLVECEDEESEEYETSATNAKKPNDLAFKFPPAGKDQCAIHYSDLKCLARGEMLNDTIIDFYLKYILYELVPLERRDKIHMFNSFFYSKLSHIPPNGRVNVAQPTRIKRIQANYQTVKSWTKRVNLFQMDYLVFPINEDIHWYLAVIANPAAGISGAVESPESAAAKGANPPLLLLFNSLEESASVQCKKNILIREKLAEYLQLEFNDKREEYGLPGVKFEKGHLRLITPNDVPQQQNYIDCGLFLLQYAELFLTKPPATLVGVQRRKPSFQSWYPDFGVKGKRDNIRTLIKRLAPEVHLYSDFHACDSGPEKKSKKKRSTPAKAKNGSKNPKLASPCASSSRKSDSTSVDRGALEETPLIRRHSESSLVGLDLQREFKLMLRHRSFDSLLDDIKDQPPPQITFKLPARKASTRH